jgi:hypothetical protein
MKRKEGIDTMIFDITPKEFAKDLFNRFYGINGVGYYQAKTCALMAVDLLIEELDPKSETEIFIPKIDLYEAAKKQLLKI